MRQIIILLFLFSTHAIAQKSAFFSIDSLPTEGSVRNLLFAYQQFCKMGQLRYFCF
jgi:CRISPR/Cas system-associated protein endoribonuclease Cas2